MKERKKIRPGWLPHQGKAPKAFVGLGETGKLACLCPGWLFEHCWQERSQQIKMNFHRESCFRSVRFVCEVSGKCTQNVRNCSHYLNSKYGRTRHVVCWTGVWRVLVFWYVSEQTQHGFKMSMQHFALFNYERKYMLLMNDDILLTNWCELHI